MNAHITSEKGIYLFLDGGTSPLKVGVGSREAWLNALVGGCSLPCYLMFLPKHSTSIENMKRVRGIPGRFPPLPKHIKKHSKECSKTK